MNFAASTACLALGAALLAGQAGATTIDFTFKSAGTPVASGTFSYAAGQSGVLGYADLSAFSVTLVGVTYNLAQVATLTDYAYFAYDTATNQFVANPNVCGSEGCGFNELLGATSLAHDQGFFFAPPGQGFIEYTTESINGYDSVELGRAAGVPEPATWGLMIAGFGVLGAAARRRRGAFATA